MKERQNDIKSDGKTIQRKHVHNTQEKRGKDGIGWQRFSESHWFTHKTNTHWHVHAYTYK